MQLQLKQALETTKACEVLAMQSRNGDLRAVFRVTDQPAWLRVLSTYLANENKEQWYSFIGQAYKLNNGSLVTAWVMFVDAPPGVSLESAVQGACRCLTQTVANTTVSDSEALFPDEATIPAAWAIGPQALSRIKHTAIDSSMRR
jgi:hypothetical protein